MKKTKNVLIIGSGPAGYTAAIYTSRANLKPILITGKYDGGQLIKSNLINNWPGQYKNINGIKLMLNMKKQAINYNTKIINDNVKKIYFNKYPFQIICNQKKYLAKTIIIATGSKPRMLNLPIEKKLYGKNISTCTNCDGYFYKNKIVAIVGGGNNAIEETLYLCNIVKKIFLIHRRNKFTADKILIKKIKKKIKNKKIIFYKNYKIINIYKINNNFINIKLKSTIKNNIIKIIKANGLFLAIGNIPNTKIFKKNIKLDINNYIITNYNNNKYKSMTNINGVFAAGDVTTNIYKQAIIASSSGCIAAIDVQKYLENIK